MTIGRNNEAPAVYATLSTIKVCRLSARPMGCVLANGSQRLLDHLTEAKLYCGKDLESISNTVESIQDIIQKGRETYSPQLVTLLDARINTCRTILSQLKENIAGISPQLVPTHDRMISILRSISAANTRQHVSLTFITAATREECEADERHSSQRRRSRSTKLSSRRSTKRGWMDISWVQMVALVHQAMNHSRCSSIGVYHGRILFWRGTT